MATDKSDSMQQTHLVCAGCGQKIAGTYFKVDGKIYCFDCNEKMGAKPAKSARPSWFMGGLVAVIILGLAGLVFYFAAGDSKTVAPTPIADLAPLPTPTAESPAPNPSANSAVVQPASSGSEVHSANPPAPAPTEALSASAVANVGEPPTETPTPAATDTPAISMTPLSTPNP